MKNFVENLLYYVEADILKYEDVSGIPCLYILPQNLVRLLTIVRDHQSFRMEQLIDIICVDYPKNTKRFTVIYHLLSHDFNERLLIKVETNHELPSITCVFKNADWHEREVFDMMGIVFTDHPDLRRILTDYNFDGYPLRKDFPVTGYTEVYYNEKTKKVDYKPSVLQERTFDFISHWEGTLRK